jgi:hypothetical protein
MQRCHDRLVILVSVAKYAGSARTALATGVVLTLKARGELDLSQSCSPSALRKGSMRRITAAAASAGPPDGIPLWP